MPILFRQSTQFTHTHLVTPFSQEQINHRDSCIEYRPDTTIQRRILDNSILRLRPLSSNQLRLLCPIWPYTVVRNARRVGQSTRHNQGVCFMWCRDGKTIWVQEHSCQRVGLGQIETRMQRRMSCREAFLSWGWDGPKIRLRLRSTDTTSASAKRVVETRSLGT